MAEEKKGTEQIKKVLDALLEAGNVADKMINEKGGALARVTMLIKMSDELIALTGLNVGELKAEWKDLDDAEKAELIAHAKEKFDILEDAVEAKIESAFDLAFEAEKLVEAGIEFGKKALAFAKAPAAPVPAPEAQG